MAEKKKSTILLPSGLKEHLTTGYGTHNFVQNEILICKDHAFMVELILPERMSLQLLGKEHYNAIMKKIKTGDTT